MSRASPLRVVTANDLRAGHVVYLTADGRWSAHLREAEVLADAAEADLRLQAAAAQGGMVIGAYLAEVRQGAEGPEPVHFRETFRANGPSIRPTKELPHV